MRVEPSPKACGMWIVEHRLWNVLKNVESGSWNMGCGMWDQGRVSWNVGCGSLMYEPHLSKRLAQETWAGGLVITKVIIIIVITIVIITMVTTIVITVMVIA